MERVDLVIVGAGVTGLAAASEAAAAGLSVCVLEQHSRPGQETSTHNSGVVHAGIYYPPGSLKARLCLEGRELLYRYCAEHDIPHARCGKLIVALRESERPILESLSRRASENGAEVAIVDRAFIASREPHVSGVAALWSPDTGIVEADTLVQSLAELGRARGVYVLFNTRLHSGELSGEGIVLRTSHEEILARVVVNAAGLYADEVSSALGGEAFTIYPSRGEYATLAPARQHLVRGLVYPLPEPSGHGLGVHLTRTTRGEVLVGPTVRHQREKSDHETDRLPLAVFAALARPLLPQVTAADLRLAGSGIRPNLNPPAESFADFLVRRDRQVPRLVHAAGIDSPGLTACLATARLLMRLIAEVLENKRLGTSRA